MYLYLFEGHCVTFRVPQMLRAISHVLLVKLWRCQLCSCKGLWIIPPPLAESGRVYATGLNNFGQLGISDEKDFCTVCYLTLHHRYLPVIVFCRYILYNLKKQLILQFLYEFFLSIFLPIVGPSCWHLMISHLTCISLFKFCIRNGILMQEPVEVRIQKEAVHISAGYNHSCVVTGLLCSSLDLSGD